jgi:hypothetical protein
MLGKWSEICVSVGGFFHVKFVQCNLSTQNGPVVKHFAQLFLKIELLLYWSEWAFELNIFILVESFPAIQVIFQQIF